MTAAPPARVCILTSVHDPFDPRIFHKQARTLATAGYSVLLLAPSSVCATVDGVRVVGLPPPRSRWGRPRLWWRLLRAARRTRADIYHFHDPELLPLGLLLARLTGRPVVYDAHEYYREELLTRPWIPRRLRRIAAEAVHRMESLAARRLAAVVTVNEHMAAGFRSRGARRAVAIHNYPSLAYFPAPVTHHDPSPVVVYAGLLNEERGLSTVWHATRALRLSLPDALVRIIGRVDFSAAPAAVSRESSTWEQQTAARLQGVIPATEVPAALAAAAAGWIPFRPTPNNTRAVPLKLLEYMAAGLPVVASDAGVMAAIVRAAGCGLLVPADDPQAHAAALARLLRNPDEARAMGIAGRRAVETRYTWEAEAGRLRSLYRDLLAGARQATMSSSSGLDSQRA